MKIWPWLLLGALGAASVYALRPQWRSLDKMAERRLATLAKRPPEILVGVCWPFSRNGDGMAEGLALALDEINRSRSAGVPLRLVLRDPGVDREQARRIAVEFAGDPAMSAVIGYHEDSQAITASTIYEASGLLHLIVGATSTPMTARGFRYIVRTVVSSEKLARALARMSAARGFRKLALIWEEDASGEELAYQYRVALDALELTLVYQWAFFGDQPDFRLPVNELRGVDADAILFAGPEPWAGEFLRTARGVGLDTEVIVALGSTPALRARAGPNALQGALYLDAYEVADPSPENQRFVRDYRARYGREPDVWAAQGHDALQLLAKAIAVTGSADPLDLSFAIRFMDPWQGANGRYRFDPRGELEDKPVFFSSYQQGDFVTVQSSAPHLQ